MKAITICELWPQGPDPLLCLGRVDLFPQLLMLSHGPTPTVDWHDLKPWTSAFASVAAKANKMFIVTLELVHNEIVC
jgi:hypothetical protein